MSTEVRANSPSNTPRTADVHAPLPREGFRGGEVSGSWVDEAAGMSDLLARVGYGRVDALAYALRALGGSANFSQAVAAEVHRQELRDQEEFDAAVSAELQRLTLGGRGPERLELRTDTLGRLLHAVRSTRVAVWSAARRSGRAHHLDLIREFMASERRAGEAGP